MLLIMFNKIERILILPGKIRILKIGNYDPLLTPDFFLNNFR